MALFPAQKSERADTYRQHNGGDDHVATAQDRRRCVGVSGTGVGGCGFLRGGSGAVRGVNVRRRVGDAVE